MICTRKLGLTLSLLTLFACSSFPPPTSQIQQPNQMLTKMKAINQNIKSVRGELRVEFWQKDERIKVNQIFLSSLPHYLYLDTLIPSGQPLSSLISDGKHLYLYEIRKQKVYKGILDKDTFEKLSRIHIEPEWFVQLLNGQIPLLKSPKSMNIEWDTRTGKYILTLSNSSYVQKLWIHAKHFTVSEFILLHPKKLTKQLQVKLGNYTRKAHHIAQRIQVKLPTQKMQVDVQLKTFEINPKIETSIFKLQVPSHIVIKEL